MTNTTPAHSLFIVNALVHIVALILGFENHFQQDAMQWSACLYVATRFLLMPALALYAYSFLKNQNATFSKYIYAALFFSFLGDVLLTFKTPLLFLTGLSAFLTAHIFYIIAYYKETLFATYNMVKQKPYIILPYVIVVACFLLITYERLQWMAIPVGIYSLVLSAMSITALNRYQNVVINSFMLTYIGSLLFMFSDLMIGWNAFYQPINYASLIIMITYIAGQYLIVKGLSKK